MRPRSSGKERHAAAMRPSAGDPCLDLPPSSLACVASICKTHPCGDRLK